MAEDTVLLDEDKVIEMAQKYVKRRENLEYLADVDILGVKPAEEGIFHYVVKGKARKRINNPTNIYLYEVEEIDFTLRIYSEDKIYYWAENWVKKNQGQVPSHSERIISKPVVPLWTEDPHERINDMLDRQTDRDLKEAIRKNIEADTEVKNRNGNDLSSLARKYGIDPSRFRKR